MIPQAEIMLDAKPASLTEAPLPRPRRPEEYKGSVMDGSALEHEVLTSSDVLFNPTTPQQVILHEKPEHRIVILLKAQGMSNKAIAERTDFTPFYVSQILRQPWARQRLMAEISDAGRDPIHELFRGELANSVHTLIELRDDPQQLGSTRAACARDIIQQVLGKPVQRSENLNTNVNLDRGDVEALDRELAELEREEARLTGGPAATETNK